MKYQIVQVFMSIDADDMFLKNCFIMHGDAFDNVEEAIKVRDMFVNPGWFKIIQVW